MEKVEIIIIGAGVVGLATAKACAEAGKEVVIIEANANIGQGISSRSSEVIHAGLYYPSESLKAKFCVEGNRLLYSYCKQRRIPFKKVGKLVVAQAGQEPQLTALYQQAVKNSVEVEWLSGHQAQQIEPELQCSAAIYSPSTGIIDSHQYMLSLLADAEASGAMLALNCRVEKGELQPDGIKVTLADGAEVLAQRVINCAGLGAVNLAHSFPAQQKLPTAFLAKGNYFKLNGKAPFTHLVYPLPSEAGLGIHLTMNLNQQIRFGPDVEWVDNEEYLVQDSRCDRFYESIRQYWPNLPENSLSADYAGIRPKIVSSEQASVDFCIHNYQFENQVRLIHLFGIESPGLTASLAIANHLLKL